LAADGGTPGEIMASFVEYSVLTCPKCGHEARERMPVDACQYYYECEGCSTLLKPRPGDCCVFCSYGTVKCPPVQLGQCGGN
jgi:hypothetical protein